MEYEPKKVLSSYSYQSGEDIKERLNQTNAEDIQGLKDCINEITLWKINRSVGVKKKSALELLLPELKKVIPTLTLENFRDSKELINRLVAVDGVRLPMASTYLHFLNEEVFPIIDQRAYREAFKDKEYKEPTKNFAEYYFDYIDRCIEYCTEVNKLIPNSLSFKDIDKYLYQTDKLRGNKVKY